MYLVEYEFELLDGRVVSTRIPPSCSILTAGDAMKGINAVLGDMLELHIVSNFECWITYDKSLEEDEYGKG